MTPAPMHRQHSIQRFLVVVVVVVILSTIRLTDSATDFEIVKDFLNTYNRKADAIERKASLASWAFETDMTDKSSRRKEKWETKASEFQTKYRRKARALLKAIDTNNITKSMLRELKMCQLTVASTEEGVEKQISDLTAKMLSIYNDNVVSIPPDITVRSIQISMKNYNIIMIQ